MGRKKRKDLEDELSQRLGYCDVCERHKKALLSWVREERKKACKRNWTHIIFFIVITFLFLLAGFCWPSSSTRPGVKFDIITAMLSLGFVYVGLCVSDQKPKIDPDEVAGKIQKRRSDKELMGLINKLANDKVPGKNKYFVLVIAVGVWVSTILKYI